MRVKFFAPSYRRPQKSITQKNYPFVKLVVSEKEAEEYRKNGNDIQVVPDSAQGNLCRIRNYILDNFFKDCEAIVLLDDDCRGIYRWEAQKKRKLEEEDLMEFCENMAILTRDWGFKFFGVNCVQDKGAYREHTPFATLGYIGGPFQGHLQNNIRYDEQFPLKEDYDITLQHIKENGGALRANFINYDNMQADQKGGCGTYKNIKEEQRQFLLLQKKWGVSVLKQDKSSKRSFDFNPILKVPLRGV